MNIRRNVSSVPAIESLHVKSATLDEYQFIGIKLDCDLITRMLVEFVTVINVSFASLH